MASACAGRQRREVGHQRVAERQPSAGHLRGQAGEHAPCLETADETRELVEVRALFGEVIPVGRRVERELEAQHVVLAPGAEHEQEVGVGRPSLVDPGLVRLPRQRQRSPEGPHACRRVGPDDSSTIRQIQSAVQPPRFHAVSVELPQVLARYRPT
jgi:hypothetical protein